jgi:hypothetical protein
MKKNVDRRGFLRKSVVATTGATLGMYSFEEKHLLAQAAEKPRGARPQTGGANMPTGKIGNLTVSRLFCGGNLMGGWAHSRDLVYVSTLVKAYHTDEKVFETLALAEEHGINAVLTNPSSARVINRYWKQQGGEIQWFSDCALSGKDLKTGIQMSIDNGAHAVYIQGGIADKKVDEGHVDELADALAFIKQQRVPGGVGAHKLDTVKACVKAGMDPDFWVKTLHPDTYWSAQREPEHDNIWSRDPDQTIAYMKTIKKPWIAFKTLAAGAVHPRVGFKYAFDNGADFVCAGMFDFQLVEDVIIARKVLDAVKRDRPWMA